jgi:hypothetical protein
VRFRVLRERMNLLRIEGRRRPCAGARKSKEKHDGGTPYTIMSTNQTLE